MAVIAGGGAEPLHLFQLAPGLVGMEKTIGVRLGNNVIHELQTCVAAYKALLRFAAQYVGKQLLGRGQTIHIAIVAAVDAVADKVLGLHKNIAQVGDHIQLLFAGLAPGHVQLQPQCLLFFVVRQHSGIFRLALLSGHVRIFYHLHFLLCRIIFPSLYHGQKSAARDKSHRLFLTFAP